LERRRRLESAGIDAVSVVLRILAATALMLAIAAIVFALSRGHVLFFPFLLILGVPLLALFKIRPPSKPP
jgi:hypothetical protein